MHNTRVLYTGSVDMSTLELSSLRKAIAQFTAGIAAAEKEPEREIIRDGAIQRFEYCYELCNKMIKRSLQMQFNEIDEVPFKQMLRMAAEHGLIRDPIVWFAVRDERNKSSHTYDANIAALVYKAAKEFLPEAQYLLERLERITD